jgi:hypothetical protein
VNCLHLALQIDGKRMITGDILARSPAITFLWVKRFPLGELNSVGAHAHVISWLAPYVGQYC